MYPFIYPTCCFLYVSAKWVYNLCELVIPKKEIGVFIDTNTFAGLMKSQREFSEEQFKYLIQKYEQQACKNYFIRTPFTLYEYLGIRIKRPEQINFKAKGFHNRLIAPLVAAKKATVEFYENSDRLQLDRIALTTKEKRQYVRPHALWLFEEMIPETLSIQDVQNMVNQLVWDHMHTTDYPEVVASAMRATWPGVINKMLRDKKNRTVIRIISKIYLYHKKSIDQKSEVFGKAFPLKTLGDFVDTELVHFAIFGYFKGCRHLRVHCFTGDTPEVIENRIWVAAHSYYITSHFMKTKTVRLKKMGFIHCINSKTLEREKTICVKEIVSDARRDVAAGLARQRKKDKQK